jgi:hypothetical protein
VPLGKHDDGRLEIEEAMIRHTLCLIAVFSLLVPMSAAQQDEGKPWQFAVSGDSRNCGDVVMPAIAKNVLAHDVEFYWHLGDFRVGYDVDEDMQQSGKPSIADYQKTAWDDFIAHQVEPFNPITVHLGIGNHEVYLHGTTKDDEALSHAEFITKFSKWIGGSKTAYYRWRSHHIDFVSMDNSSDAGFDEAQLAWLERTLKEDRSDNDARAVVVGMHRALPNSLACGHSMNGDPSSSADDNRKSLQSGRRAYEDLWDFQNTTQKHVYVIASHSHLYMGDIFNTSYWRNRLESDPVLLGSKPKQEVLKGWLVGTAGAKRYRLPDNLPPSALAITYAYGYLLATVQPNGNIGFEFQQVVESDLPTDVTARYKKEFLDSCFLGNRDDTPHPPVESCGEW